jgi:carbamoyltransferase
MIILGINSFHPDSSACLLINGKIRFAIEEERINRIKHWSGLPILSIQECLKSENISPKDIDYVAVNANFFSNFFYKIKYILSQKTEIKFLIEKIKNKNKKKDILNLIFSATSSGQFNKNCKLIQVEHHLAHAASAFYDSSYDEAVNLSVDGFGDFASLTWGKGIKDKIKIDHKILFPHSLGIFYEAFTQFLGFHNYGDEYKIMGLSSYGKPTECEKISKIIKQKNDHEFFLNLEYFVHHRENIYYSWDNTVPKQKNLFSNKILQLFGNPRNKEEVINEEHKNIAASVQKVYEDILLNIINYIYKKYKINNLTLSGGCAQNSLANGKILSNTPFSSLFIPSNPGDAGGAVGAAYYVWHNIKKARQYTDPTPYLGSSYDNIYVEKLLNNKKDELNIKKCNFFSLEENDLCNYVAKEISNSKVVGWFQGRMEWGPRALGNRSILADPRDPNIKNILNLKIKKREEFRPFAPSILLEDAKNWFDNFEDEEPFMSRVLKFKKEKANLVPGVSHIDHTGRLQTVTMKQNIRFYKLIKSFKLITGIPLVINTSFNENEPIVKKPEEALECFLRTNMDILVMQDWIVIR